MQPKQKLILLHILAILLFLGSRFVFRAPFDTGNVFYSLHVWQETFRYSLIVLFFYLNYFILIPKLFFLKKYVSYFSILLICTFLISAIPSICIPFHPSDFPINEHQHQMPFDNHHEKFFHKNDNDIFRNNELLEPLDHNIYTIICIALLSLLIANNEKLKKMTSEKMISELAFLKAQVNPHFLFNSLNSIYSLALTNSNKTPDAVLKLSNMMRYVTDESKNDWVSLDKEITYLDNYINLQKLRLSSTNKLEYETNILNKDKIIAPLILINFIENTFKHGLSTEEISDIEINITSTNDELILQTKNKIINNLKYNKTEENVGLTNSINRLNLLYPNQYNIKIEETKTDYIVILKIKLK